MGTGEERTQGWEGEGKEDRGGKGRGNMTEVGGRRGRGQRWEGRGNMTEVRGRRGRVQRWEGKRKDDRGGREKGKRTEVGREEER